MERDPAAATGPADLGLLRLSQRRYAEAIPFLRRALTMDPQFPGLRSDLARVLRERGEELRREGKGSEAETLVTEARALGAGRPSTPGPASQRSDTTTVK